MSLPQEIIGIVRSMGEAGDIEGLEYLIRFANRERDKLTILSASNRPSYPGPDYSPFCHAPTTHEGAECESEMQNA